MGDRAVLKARPRGCSTGLTMASLDERPWDLLLQQKQQKQ